MNDIVGIEQPVVAHPASFCWTIADEACTGGRVANRSKKMEDERRKITSENPNFLGIDFRISNAFPFPQIFIWESTFPDQRYAGVESLGR